MRIYRKEDFDSDTYWKIAVPYCAKGETGKDMMVRSERLLKKSGVKPIATTRQKLDLDDLLLIDGHYYSIGTKCHGFCFVSSVPDYNPDPEDNYFFECRDEPHCPYCGERIDDELAIQAGTEGTHMCPHCRAVFSYKCEMIPSWTTEPCQKAIVRRI